jgi:hypothetical protein
MTIVCVLVVLLLINPSANAGRLPLSQTVVESLAVAKRVLQYQGRLLDPSTGSPKPDGIYQMILQLYNAESGGSVVWSETKDVTVQDGLFTTLLGDTTTLNLSDFNGQPLWLSVTVGADSEATPRLRVAHVAYALHAENASMLDGQDATEFAAAIHEHDAGDITSGGLSTDRYSAYHDLNVEGKIGPGIDQVAGGDHDHDGRYFTQGESDGRYVNDNSGEIGNQDVANQALSPSKISGTAWTTGNDGAGSGLDADMVDGQHASSFAAADHSHPGTPIAFAFIGDDGAVLSGSGNVTSTWVGSPLNRYEITISRHSYFWTSYVTVVTAVSTCGNAVPVTGSVSGRLVVEFITSGGTNRACYFQFVTFKP